jgi:hypothetical protein
MCSVTNWFPLHVTRIPGYFGWCLSAAGLTGAGTMGLIVGSLIKTVNYARAITPAGAIHLRRPPGRDQKFFKQPSTPLAKDTK